MEQDFFDLYLKYVENTESPTFFHRWSAITGIGALLGRQYYLTHGHSKLFPNQYVMLLGSPGTRKSSSIKMFKELIVKTGYDTIAASKSSKEKFLMDMAGMDDVEIGFNGYPTTGKKSKAKTSEEILDENFGWNENKVSGPSEVFVMADEANNFFGNNAIDFVSLLGELWDFNGTYSSRVKNGVSIEVPDPTVSILSGNTPTGFSLMFPSEVIGQGFFSRLILVHGEPSGKRIAFPTPPNEEETERLISYLQRIKLEVGGEAQISNEAKVMLEKIYDSKTVIEDSRFESYLNRRFTHLLKLCLIFSATRLSNSIDSCDVVYANTVLTHTEHYMPRALGEFGKAKNSDVAHKVISVLEGATEPMKLMDIWAYVHQDLEGMKQLGDMVQNLASAGKLIFTNAGVIVKRKAVDRVVNGVLNYNLLTQSEIGF